MVCFFGLWSTFVKFILPSVWKFPASRLSTHRRSISLALFSRWFSLRCGLVEKRKKNEKKKKKDWSQVREWQRAKEGKRMTERRVRRKDGKSRRKLFARVKTAVYEINEKQSEITSAWAMSFLIFYVGSSPHPISFFHLRFLIPREYYKKIARFFQVTLIYMGYFLIDNSLLTLDEGENWQINW